LNRLIHVGHLSLLGLEVFGGQRREGGGELGVELTNFIIRRLFQKPNSNLRRKKTCLHISFFLTENVDKWPIVQYSKV